jgi:hypothetical protein
MRRIFTVLIVALLCVAPGLGLLQAFAATPAGGGYQADAISAASPNYRTFSEEDLKSIKQVDGSLAGGHYTCSKNSDPFSYFEQDWQGVDLQYLLEQEVGIKADTTAIKIIASDDYSVTLTLAEMQGNGNLRGLKTLLGYMRGPEGATNPNAPVGTGAPWVAPVAPTTELDATEGPFRLVMPQSVEGPDPRNAAYTTPAGAGTPNWQKSVRNVRAIEVQPTPTGLPPIDASAIPENQVVVYGNILNRHTFTVDQLKSINPTTATYHWKNKAAVEGDSVCTGIEVDYLLDEVLGLQGTATGAKFIASDGWFGKVTWTLDEIRQTWPGDVKMMLAWNIDGADLEPGPAGNGPIEFIKPQLDAADTNASKWVKWVKVIEVNPIGTDPVPDPALIPEDRIIVDGLTNAANVPSEWFLAEGCTGYGFEEWILVGNPNPWPTRVIVDYMIEGEPMVTKEYSVDSNTRYSINVNAEIGEGKNVSARVEGYHGDSIIVERSMYWNDKLGGHCAAGVNAAATRWGLAEGCTAGGFETWILVQNPGDTAAKVTLNYMDESGAQPPVGPIELPAKSRKTFNVADSLPDNWQVSTTVTSDQPVIAERAMYWDGRNAGHDAVGVSAPSSSWYLAEGCTAGGFETFVLLQNPGPTAANVQITYMNADGPVAGPEILLAANSRDTFSAGDTVNNDWNVSTMVTADQPIIAERAVYWNGRKGGHCETGNDHPKFRSYLAEGCTAGGFETWILFQNPGAMDATVYLTYLLGDYSKVREPLVIPAGKRVSINVFDDVGETYDVSAVIDASAPVVVERSVYWNDKIEGSCSKGLSAW